MTPTTGVFAQECILTSQTNLHRKLATARLAPVDMHPSLCESGICRTGFATVDGRNIPVVAIGNDQRAIPTRWLTTHTNQIVLFQREEDAKVAILDRLLRSHGVHSYQQILVDRTPVSYAIGVKSHTTLVIVAFGGEDLGLLADVEQYGSEKPKLILHWIDSQITDAPALSYLLEAVTRRIFVIDQETLALRVDDVFAHEFVSVRELPNLDELGIDLTGFEKPAGPNARNT